MSVFNRFSWTLVKSKLAANHHYIDIDNTLSDATHLEAHAGMHALNAREESEIVYICTKYIMYCLHFTTRARPFHVTCVDGHFSKYGCHARLHTRELYIHPQSPSSTAMEKIRKNTYPHQMYLHKSNINWGKIRKMLR